jgi:hypothetical protein
MTSDPEDQHSDTPSDSSARPDPRSGRQERIIAAIRWPRAVIAVVFTAAVSTTLAFYLPPLLRSASSGPPVALTVIDNTAPPGAMVLAPSQTAQTWPPSGTCYGFRDWALALGGIDAGNTDFQLVVQGKTREPVYVAGIRAVIVERLRPATGTLVHCPYGGRPPIYSVHIPLDTSGAGEYIRRGKDAPFGFTVQNGESAVFNISASADHSRYIWVLDVDLVVSGRHKILTIRDQNRPFDTTAVARNAPFYELTYFDHWLLVRGGRQSGPPVSRGQPLQALPIQPSS